MESAKNRQSHMVIESEIIIGNIRFHVKSVFIGKVKLDDALKNIAMKKQRDSSLPKAG